MSYSLLRNMLFLLPAEVAHHVSLRMLQAAHLFGFTKFFPQIVAPQNSLGLHFANPVGLAAGLDKNGDFIDALGAIGFGFIEIGTVTPKPQPGNPPPRLFRLPEHAAIINRMGFNNKGLDYVVARLQKTKYTGVLGVNIGKNRDTPIENAIEDYVLGFRGVAPYASYVTINISSPNTSALRDLQHGDLLQSLLKKLKQEQTNQAKYVPLLVKIAPDLTPEEIKNTAEILLSEKIDGVIATNTTTQRAGVENSKYANEIGGLSGKPLLASSTAVIQQLHVQLQNKIPIIACGGISNAKDAVNNIAAGASLVQIYTGLIYQGPRLISELASGVQPK